MPMPPLRRKMHLEFLQEIRETREELQKELDELQAVEAYHADQLRKYGVPPEVISEISPPDSSQPNGKIIGKFSLHLENGPSDETPKHEAAAWAIQKIGHEAKVGEIVDELTDAGYGLPLGRRILHNSLHTAMSRKEDVFKKVRPGVWDLIGYELDFMSKEMEKQEKQ